MRGQNLAYCQYLIRTIRLMYNGNEDDSTKLETNSLILQLLYTELLEIENVLINIDDNEYYSRLELIANKLNHLVSQEDQYV